MIGVFRAGQRVKRPRDVYAKSWDDSGWMFGHVLRVRHDRENGNRPVYEVRWDEPGDRPGEYLQHGLWDAATGIQGKVRT